jgi:hypothetical protein
MSLYEQDFYRWTQEQTALLKAGALAQLDIENLIEEVESLGKSQKHELINRLIVLATHMLKWDYQPGRQGKSWILTIKEQRLKLSDHLEENPSLKSILDISIVSAYRHARLKAARETGLAESIFPETCPYSAEQIMGNL